MAEALHVVQLLLQRDRLHVRPHLADVHADLFGEFVDLLLGQLSFDFRFIRAACMS
jgi:hypothetical protein